MARREQPNEEIESIAAGQKPEQTKEAGAKPKEQTPAEQLLKIDQEAKSAVTELEQLQQATDQSREAGVASLGLAKKLEAGKKRLQELEHAKQDWVRENGLEKLPENVVVATDNGQELKLNFHPEETEKLSPQERRRIIDEWKERAVKQFAAALENDWQTKDAVNLSLVIDILKVNLPQVLEKRTRAFVDGQADVLPDYVLMQWKHNSLLEKFIGKPNQIRELSFKFGNETEVLAGPEQLVKEDAKDTGKEEKPQETKPRAEKQAA